MTAETELRAALDPKNFPRWAQSCPKSFEEMQKALARAAVALAKLRAEGRIDANVQGAMSMVLADVASTCWAAGQKSVEEGNLDVKALHG